MSSLVILWLVAAAPLSAQQAARITVNPSKLRQEFHGLGAGAIFYEGHITSLAARQKDERQEQLYDDMFKHVPTRYLQLMIRHDHEPANDNDDPFTPAFDEKHFEYCRHTLAIAKAALKRRPDMEFFATLYTPPPWMKTNHAVSAGGAARATIKDGMDLELAEFAYAFLDHMRKHGVTVKYLAICNEPDWPHEQPGYCLTAQRYAELLANVGQYFERMARKFPDGPRPQFAGPNTLSAPGCAKDYLPQALRKAGRYVDVIASHDYDPRGDRFGGLQKLARGKPVWMSEWCYRDMDTSPNMIDTAMAYGSAMHHAFSGDGSTGGGGANVWMAYDWVYPKPCGESLISVDWGNDYKLTKQYHLFRQWAEHLTADMRIVDAAVAGAASVEGKPGVKVTAFIAADRKTVVVHLLNSQEKPAAVSLRLTGPFASVATATVKRTSASEDAAELPELKRGSTGFDDTLPAKSLTTLRFER